MLHDRSLSDTGGDHTRLHLTGASGPVLCNEEIAGVLGHFGPGS